MARCTVNPDSSAEFKALLRHWKRSYPHIESDVQKAFVEIGDNILSCHGRLIMGGPRFDVYKYRQKSSDIPRGSSYGLRIICLHDRKTGILYAILAYPKPQWEDVDNQTIYAAIKSLKQVLGHCAAPDCDGEMRPVQPQDIREDNKVPYIKIRCAKCNTVDWREMPVENETPLISN